MSDKTYQLTMTRDEYCLLTCISAITGTTLGLIPENKFDEYLTELYSYPLEVRRSLADKMDVISDSIAQELENVDKTL